MNQASIKEEWIIFIEDLQNRICSALEAVDGKTRFGEDEWKRPEGGGGKTRVMEDGAVFEKAGVSSSVVYGELTDAMRTQLKMEGSHWFASGLSLIIHPFNPFVPTIHGNYRMFELYDKEKKIIDRWFGGGTDLTPYYLFDEDARHFHETYKKTCDQYDPDFYRMFKTNCDQYFVNRHRHNECRGIGGIFYDYQRAGGSRDEGFWLNFSKACGYAFLDAYLPLVEKRKGMAFTEKNKRWQEIRRGRYVEFNLVHDRGTLFGLKTNGRIESILMSLPPTVRFEYGDNTVPGSEEDKLLQVCLHPVNWA